MRRSYVFGSTTLVVVLAGTAWLHQRAAATQTPPYRTAAVEQGDLHATVSATGALSAVRTVQVGTQVSGQISAIYVDFNSHVHKGQLLARIDPTLQQQAVQDAQAGLARAQAQLAQAQAEYDRTKPLYDQRMVTATEYTTAEMNYSVSKANVRSAEIAEQRARQNLAYTNIYAPIDGVVVQRNMDVGQTVAASLQAPQLFLIANDLSQMQILASIDESDIGAIQEGQPVSFTVQAYPNRTFDGTVRQVRLQSTTQDNVVSYTVVVGVDNSSGKLLPGMTATVQVVTGTATNALLVPNAALRLRPTAQMLASAGISAGGGAFAKGGSAGNSTSPHGVPRDSTRMAGRGGRGNGAMLWSLDAAGKATPVRVRVGLTDGQRTAVQAPALRAGQSVIVGVSTPDATTTAASGTTNPFQPPVMRGGFGRGAGR